MKKIIGFTMFGLLLATVGCGGSNQAIMPSSALTDEQKAAIKAEDAAVADEESQGSNNKKKK
jgi:hypothetical protein